MRLHRLAVTAFGPFAGTETVDFDALTEAGLFLLHGSTGAGKTSVLDAVCFALYGVVPGARQQGGHLRSDHAAPDVRPEVVLDVSVAGRRVEIIRSPAWERPKRRGSGTTTEPARTLVRERRDGEWIDLTSRNDEAGQLVQSLTGMNASQFTQVVMLPQGRFAEFLRADAETRRLILEQLFVTHRFSDVETWLADQRRVLDRAVTAADQAIGELLARVAEAADAAPPDGEIAPATWLDTLCTEAAALVTQETQAADWARAELRAAEQALRDAERVAGLQARHAEAMTSMTVLEAAEPEQRQRRAELTAARRAAVIAGHLHAVHRCTDRLANATSAAEAAVAAVVSLMPDIEPEPMPLRLAAKGLREEAGRLGELARDAEELARVRAELAQTQAGQAAETAELDVAQAFLSGADTRRVALARELVEMREAAAGMESAELSASAARRQLTAVRQLAKLRPRQSAAADGVRDAIDIAQAARERWLALRAARLDGMAAELAEGLVDGHPCPVCGGFEHPQPATSTAEAVRDVDEAQAREEFETADRGRVAAQDTLAAVTAEVVAASARAVGDTEDALPDETELLTKIDALEATLEQARAALARVPDLERAIDDLDAEVERTRSRHQELLTAAATRLERISALEQRIQEIDAMLIAAVGPGVDPLARAAEVTASADTAHAAAEALLRRAEAEADLETATGALAVAAAEASFADVEGAVSALREEDAVATLEQRCRDHDDARARVSATLEDAEVAAAAQLPAADLTPLRERQDVLASLHEAAVGRLDAATRRQSALDRLSVELTAASAESAPLRERARLVGELSRLAEGTGGGNTLRMRLSSYVLAARLEAVAEAASARLLDMSGGRYTLVHSAEAGGRGRAGLGLRIVDAWTGADRHPSTLSGGESFFASLALALGLADVVAQEAGGARIETLFVDEGFGSLDDETLDEVMDTLDALRDGGRAVGLVSHVGDLRQRVTAQLHVIKGRAGSHLRQSS
ncbi:MAG TPA: SMC family ATPase [Actinomycetes bacterium]|nr:SMC family ATPase [Actinomycetes bacterium]